MTTAVEHFVKGMLRTHTIQSLPKKFVQKALVLVETKLDNPCCTDSDATIDMITTANSPFVNTVEALLNLIPKAGNVASLNKVKRMLERRLDCSC